MPHSEFSQYSASTIARLLAQQIKQLASELLPGGHREGHEWRAGSIAGEAGNSLGLHLKGQKAGIWCDFSTDHKGDALDLVAATHNLSISEALTWARRWLGLEEGEIQRRPATPPERAEKSTTRIFWQRPWRAARPIAGTIAEVYLANRGLAFADPAGDVLRFTPRHGRRNPAGELEHHPALLALLRDVHSGEACGIINVFLRPDGSDRLRDEKGKTSWGRALGSAVMLDAFEDVTYGLVTAEGVETAIALHMRELRPVWALGGAGNLGDLPVLAGIECLTVAADNDENKKGQEAAAKVSRRWQAAGRETLIITPPAGDWADGRAAA